MQLLVFAALHRKQSINRKLATIAASIAKDSGAVIDFSEYGTFDMPIYDDEMFDKNELPDSATRFVTHLKKADGIILSSPEYNWSFPGSLKNIIDWASVVTPNPFAGKTALLLSASPSLRGGAQGLVHLKVPLAALGVFVFPRVFTLARAGEALDGKGGFKIAKLHEELKHLVRDFLAMTKVIRACNYR
jgi:chromate reductase, NAD(P)H dehydrogenase (quinone)